MDAFGRSAKDPALVVDVYDLAFFLKSEKSFPSCRSIQSPSEHGLDSCLGVDLVAVLAVPVPTLTLYYDCPPVGYPLALGHRFLLRCDGDDLGVVVYVDGGLSGENAHLFGVVPQRGHRSSISYPEP